MALQVLFSLDMHGSLNNILDLQDVCNLCLEELETPHDQDDSQVPVTGAQDMRGLDISGESFFANLVQGVSRNIVSIDELISVHCRNWKLSRMSFVDRNILRLAVYELIHCPDIPMPVSINEAVDLGKIYGTRESGRFINGILDGIRMSLEKEGIA